jgi:intergrase/recombinase
LIDLTFETASPKLLFGRHILRTHSISKFFHNQLAALGVPADYIEYMMSHTISTYHMFR